MVPRLVMWNVKYFHPTLNQMVPPLCTALCVEAASHTGTHTDSTKLHWTNHTSNLQTKFFAVTSWILHLLNSNYTGIIITTYYNNLLMFDRRNMCFKLVQLLWTFEVMTQLFGWQPCCFVYILVLGAVKYNFGFCERNEIVKTSNRKHKLLKCLHFVCCHILIPVFWLTRPTQSNQNTE